MEVKRRQGVTWAKFRALYKIWRGKRIRKRTKIRRADSISYGSYAFNVSALSLNREEEQRVRSFQNRVIRYVFRTPPVGVIPEGGRQSTKKLRERYNTTEWVDRVRNSPLGKVIVNPDGGAMEIAGYSSPGAGPPLLGRYG